MIKEQGSIARRAVSSSTPDPAEATSRLVNAFCHDCRTPLAVIAEIANLLCDDFNAGDTSEAIEFLSLISKRVIEIEGYISDYQALNRLSIPTSRQKQTSTAIGDLFDRLEQASLRTLNQYGHSLTCQFDPATPIINCEALALSRAVAAIVQKLAKNSCVSTHIFLNAAPSRDGLGIQLSMIRPDEPGTIQEILSVVSDPENHETLDNSDADFRVLVAEALIGELGGHIHCIRQMRGSAFIMHLPACVDHIEAEQDANVPDAMVNENSEVRGMCSGI